MDVSPNLSERSKAPFLHPWRELSTEGFSEALTLGQALTLLFPSAVVKFTQTEERHLTKNQTSVGMKVSAEERLVRAEQSGWAGEEPYPTIFAVWALPHVRPRRCSSEGRFNMEL